MTLAIEKNSENVNAISTNGKFSWLDLVVDRLIKAGYKTEKVTYDDGGIGYNSTCPCCSNWSFYFESAYDFDTCKPIVIFRCSTVETCPTEKILEALNLTYDDLWPKNKKSNITAINKNTPQLQLLLDRLTQYGYNPKLVGDEYRSHCPGHSDEHPSLDIRDGTSRVLLTCRSNDCRAIDIITPLGLTLKELQYNPTSDFPTNSYKSKQTKLLPKLVPPKTYTFPNNRQPLTSEDLAKLKKSYISEDLVNKAQLFRVDDETARAMFGIKNKNGDYAGIIFPYLIDGQVVSYRLRRDNPEIEQKADGTYKEENKYRSAPGALIYPYIPTTYSKEQLTDSSLPVFFVEGEKKALGLCNAFDEINYKAIVIGLAGVYCFTSKIGKQPAPNGGYVDVKGLLRDIVALGLEGRKTFIIYDTNIHTNDDVGKARNKLARTLKEHNATVISVDLPKELLDEGLNGVDDVLFSKGTDYLVELIENAESKNASKTSDVKIPRPKGSLVADILADEYENKLAYDASVKQWRIFDGHKWNTVEFDLVKKQVQKDVKHHYENTYSYFDGYEDRDINSILGLLKSSLTLAKWEQKQNLLPLKNGVLDVKTLALTPHCPENKLTFELPYSYDPTANCQPIIEWLLEITENDFQIVQFLRAFIRAVLLGRTDLQIYLELIGFAGTGKGTFIRLLTALVGTHNTTVTDMENLETNRFETAKLFGKRLAIITDADQYTKSLRVLKQLTGQDRLRAEKKGKDSFDFTPECLVVIAANEAIQTGDLTSGVARRKRTVLFNKLVDPSKRRNLIEETRDGFAGEFIPYLPGLLNWALEMTDQEMISAIHNNTSEKMQQTKLENLLNTNPIANWFDENVVIDPTAKVKVGLRNADSRDHLYSNYCCYIDGTGNKPISVKRFSSLLEDLCVAQLKIDVSKKRIPEGVFFFGITTNTTDKPSYSISSLLSNLTSNEGLMKDNEGLMKDNEGSMKDCMKGLIIENEEFIKNEGFFDITPYTQQKREKESIDGYSGNAPKTGNAGDEGYCDNNNDIYVATESEKILHKSLNPSFSTNKPFIQPFINPSSMKDHPSLALTDEEKTTLIKAAIEFTAKGRHQNLPFKICAKTSLEQTDIKKWLPVFLSELNSTNADKREKAVKEVCLIMKSIKKHFATAF